MQRRCGWRLATSMQSRPVAPPTSQSVLNCEKSNFSREGLEVDARQAGHRAHELLEPRRVAVELLEHRLSGRA